MIWKGNATPLPDDAFEVVADRLRCDPRAVEAVWNVETAGREYRADMSLTRRLEPHHLPEALQDLVGFTVPPGVAPWRASLAIPFNQREWMFNTAVAHDQEATLDASSWGGPQILGDNAEICGHVSATAMVKAMAGSSMEQLRCFEAFCVSKGIDTHLRAQNWLPFAEVYNGSGQAQVYANRMAVEFLRVDGKPSRRVIQMGDRGPAVNRAQLALGIEADGMFGANTGAAVRAFQRQHGLAVDGIVGARTWAKLDEVGPKEKPTLEPEELRAILKEGMAFVETKILEELA